MWSDERAKSTSGHSRASASPRRRPANASVRKKRPSPGSAAAGALGLRVEDGEIAVGDRLAYELPVEFVEEVVASLQIEQADVSAVSAPAHVGVTTSLNEQQARKGVRVYRVAAASVALPASTA
jgi:hypothetical protein